MVNSSKKTIMLLTNIKLLLFFRLKSLKEISIRLSSTKAITFSSSLLGTSLILDFLKPTHAVSHHSKNEVLISLFNSITSLALWRSRPIRVGNSKKKVKKLNKRKRFRKRFSIKLRYNVRKLMLRFKRSYLWRKVKRSKKGRLSSLMPVLPLHFNKQKVLSRKAKKRRRNKKVIRATLRNWKFKKRFKKTKRNYKSFSRQRLYMTKSTLSLHYPRFFVKKTTTRKSSYLNLQKNRQFKKNLFKGLIKNLQYTRKDSSMKIQSKRKASLFIKGKELFNRNSIKIGPVERRLLVNDLNYLDLKGFFTKVNLLPTSSFTKHPFLSKKKNFKRSVFMLRFFKGVDYNIIRSNLEISKFLNSPSSRKLWRKADPALVLKRVIIRQLRGRFRRMVSRAANSCQLMKPLSFEKELTKFKNYTMGFSKNKTFKKAIKVRRALFISKFSNDYNYLLDKSPVALSTSLSFLSGTTAVRGLSKLSAFNPLTHEVNLPNYLEVFTKPVESVEDLKHPLDLNSNEINSVDKELIVTNHKKVKFVLKNFFNRSLFDKAIKLLEDSVKQRKITYNTIVLNKTDEHVDDSKIDTNRGALTGVSNEVAKYSDLLSKADNNSILKINRNPLLENDQSVYEPHYCDLDMSLKDILSCLDSASLKRPSGLTLNYLHHLSAYNFDRSVTNQGNTLNSKNEGNCVNISLSSPHSSATRYSVERKRSNSLKIKLLNIRTVSTKKSRYKLKPRRLSSKNKNLKSVFYKLKLSRRMPLRRNVKVRLNRKLDKKKLKSILRTLSPINLRVLREKSLKLLENKECSKGNSLFANLYKEKKIFERDYLRTKFNNFKSMSFLESSYELGNVDDYNLSESDAILRRPKISITRGFSRKKKSIIKGANLAKYALNLMRVRPFRYKTKHSFSNRDFLKKKKNSVRSNSLSNLRILHTLVPKNWLKRVRHDAKDKVSLSKSLYFKGKSKWINFRSKIRYFKPSYASVKYNFKKKVFINRNISKRVKLNPGSVRTKKVILGAMIKPRVEFLFNSSTTLKDIAIQSRPKSKNMSKLKKRYTLQNINKFAKLITTTNYTELDSKKKNTKLKLVKPLDLKNLSKSSVLFNNIIELIKPKLELMSYSNKNGPNRRARLKNKIKFMIRSKPYKFLKKLMKFTTDTYTPLIKHRKYLNRHISRDNVEIFKKNLFVDSVYMSRDNRDPYYEAMALFNSRLRPTHKKEFIFKKFYFNQRSLSILKYPHFKRNQVNLVGSLSVDRKRVGSIKGMLKKKVRKALFAYTVFNHPKLTSKKINFILGKTSGLKKIQNMKQKDLKKTKLIESSTKTNTFANNKVLKKKSSNTDRLLTKLDKISLFYKKKKIAIPESNSRKNLLLAGLEKKIKERKHANLSSLLRSKPIKVFKKNINTLNLPKYRYIRLKQLSYLSVKEAPKLKYLGFKKLKRFFKLNTVKLTLKRKAAFLNERRLKAPNRIERSTLLSNKRVFMLYKDDSKKYKYKRKFYKPINFNTYGFFKENKAIKKLLLSSKNKYKGGSLKKEVRFLNKDKPHLVLLGSIRSAKRPTKGLAKGPKNIKINNKSVKTKKKIPFLYKLYKITENFKKSRMGKEYKYIPGVNLYQGKAYNFRSKLVRMCNFLNNKADKNLNTYIKMHKRSKSHLLKLASQRLKRKIFFGLNYNVETRYSLALKKKYLKKAPRNSDIPYNKRELIRSDILRNSNNLPINIGRSIRSKKLKKIWKAALRKKKDEFSSSFRKKLNLFKRIIKGRKEPVLSSSSLKKKTLNFNIKLLNANGIFKESNWKLNLLSSPERHPAYLDLNNLSIFKYKEFATKLFKLYTQFTRFGRFDLSVNKPNTLASTMPKGNYYFNLNFSYSGVAYYSAVGENFLSPLKTYTIPKTSIYLFRKSSLFETDACNQVKLTYLKVSKKLIDIDKANYTNPKKRKKTFIIKSNSIRNKYSKGYKIFLLNRFRLQLNTKSISMVSNSQLGVTSELRNLVAINLILANSFFSLITSAKLPIKIEARALDTLKKANFNSFSNKLSYLLLNNLLLKPKSKMIKFNKLFFNFKSLPITHHKTIDSSLKGLPNQPETKSHKYLSSVLRPKKTKTKLKLNNFLNDSVFFMWDLIASSVTQSRFSVVSLDLINFICKSKNIVRVIAKKMVGMLFFEFRNLTPTFFIREVIYLIVISIRYKDTTLFMNWLTMYMNKIEIKKQKKVIAFLRKLVRLLRKKNYFYRLGCLGFFFDVRGKVGVTGNKKKRNYVVKYGTSSSSNKNVRWSLDKNIIRTTTGVLGTTLIITY